MTDEREVQNLESKIRKQVFAMIGAFLAQAALLGFAIQSGSAAMWVVWVACAVVAALGIVLAARRARALSRRYRFLKFGDLS